MAWAAAQHADDFILPMCTYSHQLCIMHVCSFLGPVLCGDILGWWWLQLWWVAQAK